LTRPEGSPIRTLIAQEALPLELTIQHLQSAVDGDPVKAELALSEMELIGMVLTETRSDSTITDISKYLRNCRTRSARWNSS